VVLSSIFHHLGWDQITAYRTGAIKGVVRRDAMGFDLRLMGVVRNCCVTPSSNACAYFHGNLEVADFGSIRRALSRKIAEIQRLWISRGQVSLLVSALRYRKHA
jgi:hypothetical protein